MIKIMSIFFSKENKILKEKKKELKQIEELLVMSKKTLSNAKRDLGSNSTKSVNEMLEHKTILRDEKLDKLVNYISSFETIISCIPKTIQKLEDRKEELENEIKVL
jgi:5-methylcytosine-specific restriction endonuclease McrBC regulatory subunit McrC